MFKMYGAIVLFVLVCGASSQLPLKGTCKVDPGQAVANVDIIRMLGVWNQIERIPNSDELGDCSTTTYAAIDWTQGSVTDKEVLDNGTVLYRHAIIYKADDNNGRFVITYESIDQRDYYVLTTDYQNFALIYSCKPTSDSTKNVWAWKLSRNKDLSSSYMDSIETAIALNPDLKNVVWRDTRQNEC